MRGLAVVLFVLTCAVALPLLAQTIKNADGTTTTITPSDKNTFEPGKTKETTRNEKGDIVKEEFKDDKGRTLQVKYTTVQANGNLRVDEIRYDPTTGQPKCTSTSITDPNTGITTSEGFNYKDSTIYNGIKVVSDTNGAREYYKYDPVSHEWSALDTNTLDPMWLEKFWMGSEDALEPWAPKSPPRWNFLDDVFGNVGCCEDGVQGLAMKVKARLPGQPTFEAAMREPWVLSSIRYSQPMQRRPQPQPAIVIAATSLGVSQGDAFQLQLINNGSEPIELDSVVMLEPVKTSSRNDAQKALQAMASKLKSGITVNAEGYCLNYALKPPSAGMQFRVASPDVQRRYANARRVLEAAARLDEKGRLTPDSNPKLYVESIKQYALWTSIEKWDESGFTRAWVDTTRKQLAAAKRAWTAEIDNTLRRAAPRRWKDIQATLAAAR